MITIDATLTSLIIATLLPLVVGVITKASAPSWVRVVALIVLNAIGGAIAVSITDDGAAVVSKETMINTLQMVVQSIAVYYGVWKPTVSAKLNEATKTFGIG